MSDNKKIRVRTVVKVEGEIHKSSIGVVTEDDYDDACYDLNEFMKFRPEQGGCFRLEYDGAVTFIPVHRIEWIKLVVVKDEEDNYWPV